MLLLISALSFLTMFLMVYVVLTTYAPMAGVAQIRLKALDKLMERRSDVDEELATPFSQRILSPLTGSVATRLARLTPRAIRRMVEEKLLAAGGMGGMGANEFLLLCVFLGLALPAVIVLVASAADAALHKIIAFALYGFAVGIYLPFFLLNRKIKFRRHSMVRDLPDVLDLLTVSVEAGLGFVHLPSFQPTQRLQVGFAGGLLLAFGLRLAGLQLVELLFGEPHSQPSSCLVRSYSSSSVPNCSMKARFAMWMLAMSG